MQVMGQKSCRDASPSHQKQTVPCACMSYLKPSKFEAVGLVLTKAFTWLFTILENNNSLKITVPELDIMRSTKVDTFLRPPFCTACYLTHLQLASIRAQHLDSCLTDVTEKPELPGHYCEVTTLKLQSY